MQGSVDGKYKLRALRIAAVAIFSVVIVEVSIGFFVNSLAILSDGLHALLDAVSTVMLFFAVRASIKPPDEEHTYGHEKFETIGGLIGGVVLIAVAFLIFYEAALRLTGMANAQINQGLEFSGFIAVGYAIFVASLRVTVFRKGQHIESPSMKVGFYDAVSDLSSTLLALVGFALATLGFYYGDALASIFLGVMLSYLSVKLVRVSVMELSDTASKELVQKTRKIIVQHDGVVQALNLKVRKVSSKIFIDASIQVPSHMPLEEAHSLASKIEADLKHALGNVDATIHIEPSEKESKLDQLVERLATVDGVKQVHEISTVYTGGKFYITLHAYVDPELSVEEAHKIAQTIEIRLQAEIKPLENVTVHVEPSGIAVPAIQVDESQIRNVIHEMAKTIAENLRIKRIVTYAADGKRYINIDCCFTKQIQIKEAHRLASEIEKETKDRFAGAVVTVHIEPECVNEELGKFLPK
ncbi:MAG TPA: cation diffusion facilitator family transporter [Candidatus Bathyarchaeia archaeon]|nr:cation diffusion facilitator family transporter [Candidatus Bathyarchaeia archaeon]